MNSILEEPEDLILENNLRRTEIKFRCHKDSNSDNQLVKNFRERRDKEKELLASRSIEEIINELDTYCNSEEYQNFKKMGVNFLSDAIKIDKQKMKTKISKIKGKRNPTQKKRKRYLNKNVKALINIVKFYSEDGRLDFKAFQNHASEEEISERKFYTHFNQACYLGFLEQIKDEIYLVKDYD